MIRPVIPVVRRQNTRYGSAPTTGIPQRAGNGIRISQQQRARFVAGVVFTFGGLIVNPNPSIATKGIQTIQVRNDFRPGKVVKIGAVRTPAPSLSGISPKGIKVYQVRNDSRNGRVFIPKLPHDIRAAETFLVHRQSTLIFKRRHVNFNIPPITSSFTQWRIPPFRIFQRALTVSDYNNRRGFYLRTGPRLTGEAAAIVPSIARGLAVRPSIKINIPGKCVRWSPSRTGFFIAVDRIPQFRIYQNRSSYNARRATGRLVRTGRPRNSTQTSFGMLNIYKGDEIIIPGQFHIWQPRRVDFIPSIQQNVPKILKIYGRPRTFIRGQAYRIDFRRFTSQFNTNKGIHIFSQVKYDYRRFTGKTIFIRSPRQNPPATGSLKHGLIRLSEFRIVLSVKRENDGGKESVFSADATGTVISFNKAFKIVESITVTSLNTNLETAIYDFNHATQNPTTFKVKLFDGAGIRINGTVSWKARGIL